MNILEKIEFRKVLRELKKLKGIESILLFGSAVKSRKYGDLDILIFFKEINPRIYLNILENIERLDKKYNRFSFAFAFGESKNKKSSRKIISLVTGSKKERDEIFEYSVRLNHKVFFGKNPYKDVKKPGVEFFIPILLRQKNSKSASYKIIKQYLFIGLLWKDIYEKKENLLKRFDREYKTEIFKDCQNINKFIEKNETNLLNKYLELESIILQDMKLKDKNCLKKKIRPYSKRENFIFSISSFLVKNYSNKSFKEIESFLLDKQKEYEKLNKKW